MSLLLIIGITYSQLRELSRNIGLWCKFIGKKSTVAKIDSVFIPD